ncbi:MAG TPA: hypothetical protein VK518_05385, partial [Puia sp.]|nr:hypothetical protein [Puia sp.]
MANVYLNRKISRRVENGHPWIFGNEIEKVEGDAAGGSIVDVFTFDKKFVGRGYINMQSQIAVRLLTRNRNEEINDEFFYNRLRDAWTYRQQLGYTENCRLVFGEADYMPALIIDKFND